MAYIALLEEKLRPALVELSPPSEHDPKNTHSAAFTVTVRPHSCTLSGWILKTMPT